MATKIQNAKLLEALKANKLSSYYIMQWDGDYCEVRNTNYKKALAMRWSDADTGVYTDNWRDLTIDEWIDFIKKINDVVLEWLKEYRHEIF